MDGPPWRRRLPDLIGAVVLLGGAAALRPDACDLAALVAALDSGVAGPLPLSGERSMVLPMTGGSSWAGHPPAAAG
jgi:hypothetical protein